MKGKPLQPKRDAFKEQLADSNEAILQCLKQRISPKRIYFLIFIPKHEVPYEFWELLGGDYLINLCCLYVEWCYLFQLHCIESLLLLTMSTVIQFYQFRRN